MTRVTQRNIEIIRKRNLEDNKIFFEQLLLTSIRKDFISSARSVLPKQKPIYRTYEKVDRVTRYNENVKAGKILPHVPEWQRLLEEKKKAIEFNRIEKQKRLLESKKRKEERLLILEKRKEERLLNLEKRKERLLELEKRKEERLRELEKREEEFHLEIEQRKAEQRELYRQKREIRQQEDRLLYKRVFVPRQTNVGRRAEENSF